MNAISRRDLFRRMLGQGVETPVPEYAPRPALVDSPDSLALILDRFCLAWQGSFCSVCSERCPVEGAITTEQGKPRIDPAICTGCRICHDVCPAPKNAVFMVARSPRQGMIARPTEPANA